MFVHTLLFFNSELIVYYISLLNLYLMLDPKYHYMCFVLLRAESFKVARWEY